VTLSAKEGGLVVRAAASSLAATIADGIFYQVVLALLTRAGVDAGYAAAALVGAVVGAVTNFLLNRYWVFRSREKAILVQGSQYALGSLLTLLLLEALLWILIERFLVDARLAWLPAKIVVWFAFSYPFQRVFVFAGAKR
jgi:putative flippase GtrA